MEIKKLTVNPHLKTDYIQCAKMTNLKANYYDSRNNETPHTHNFCEFFLIITGKLLHIINNSTQILEEMDLCFVRTTDIHYFKQYGDSSVEWLNIAIPDDLLDLSLKHHNIDKESVFSKKFIDPVKLQTNEYYSLVQKINRFQHEPPEKKRGSMFFNILSDVLYAVFLKGKDADNAAATLKIPNWFGNLLLELEKKENLLHGVDTLKSSPNYSYEHICRCFKKHLNLSPTDYVNRIRVKHAAFLLVTSDDNILDIALSSGFRNGTYFHKVFKKVFLMTPHQYRKKYQSVVRPNHEDNSI